MKLKFTRDKGAEMLANTRAGAESKGARKQAKRRQNDR